MTVCIAAICDAEDEDYIVTVSDTKLTTGYYSSDAATLKLRNITHKWKCLIAGKFAQHRPLLTKIQDLIAECGYFSCDAISKACTDAFIWENRRLAEEKLLAQYALNMKEFVNSRQALGDIVYERILEQISKVKLDCELIVCGFDDDDDGHVFVLGNPSEDNPSFITDCDYPGFAAIGTGSYLADSYLHGVRQNRAEVLPLTIYNAMHAKFLSEAATDIGEETYVHVFGKYGKPLDLPIGLGSEVRRKWKEDGQPKIIKSVIKPIIESLPENLLG